MKSYVDYPICVYDPVRETILNDQELVCFIRERCGQDVAEKVQAMLPGSPDSIPDALHCLRDALSAAEDAAEKVEEAIEKLEKMEE